MPHEWPKNIFWMFSAVKMDSQFNYPNRAKWSNANHGGPFLDGKLCNHNVGLVGVPNIVYYLPDLLV